MRHSTSLRVGLVSLLLVLGVTCLPLLAVGSAPGGPPRVEPAKTVAGIPPRVLGAYQAAGTRCPGLRWQLLAGIGHVETAHGSFRGAVVDPDTGEVTPWILGIPLDGTNNTLQLPIGGWAGVWGLTGTWQRALGPMQFLAPTFDAWGVDGDSDGARSPHDIDDAVASAANYLCGGRNGRLHDERVALRRYNADDAYADAVLSYAASLTAGPLVTGGSWLCPIAGPTAFTDTWAAPRSGGRQHQGVDMFAARGTPVVASVPGVVEHANDSLGGLSYRLWGDDGTYYYGTHLAAHGPITGRVPAGTIVGYVGESGNAAGTGPHLHFEIHPGREKGSPPAAINPTPTVNAACANNRLGMSFTNGS